MSDSENERPVEGFDSSSSYESLDIAGLKRIMSETLNELEWKNRGALPEVRDFKRRIDQFLNIERNATRDDFVSPAEAYHSLYE